MAITRQGTPASQSGTGLSFDAGTAGNDRLITIVATQEGAALPTAFTVDGKSCTSIVGPIPNSNNRVELWAIDETALGASAGTVSIAFTGGDADTGILATLYYGVDSSTADTTYSDTDVTLDTASIASINASAGDLIVFGATHNLASDTNRWLTYSPAGLTQRLEGSITTSGRDVLADEIAASSHTNVTFSAQINSGTFARSAQVAAVWAPAAGVTGTGATTSPAQTGTGAGTTTVLGTGATTAPAQTSSAAGGAVSAADTHDGASRKTRIVDTRRRDRADEQGRLERDAQEAERRAIIERTFREIVEGLPPELAADEDLVAELVAEELSGEQPMLQAREIATLIMESQQRRAAELEQQNNDALAFLLLVA